jgi:16S rRNA U1498 N3-methylase RsmE
MALLAAQPTEEGALQQFGVEPIRLRPAVLADTATLVGWIT